ncbi:hypothetical protein MSG28_014298 [Choristoneura fumiferana]|uniref:Uncharacterized protein n=1 Tax=Choristoneura fumiferana TaxID=7141 RepID=A0ACC0JGV6_CHOFU|nr:hypothetical protein MSG28_014298 [Choristoneura fumiferana]
MMMGNQCTPNVHTNAESHAACAGAADYEDEVSDCGTSVACHRVSAFGFRAGWHGKRPDGVTLVPWKLGRALVWDATCVDTFALSHIQATSSRAGAAADQAQLLKRRKYSSLLKDYEFAALAVETLGPWSADMKCFIKAFSSRLIDTSGDPRAELSMREQQVTDLRLELDRVNGDLHSFKHKYYEMKRALDADEARRLKVVGQQTPPTTPAELTA